MTNTSNAPANSADQTTHFGFRDVPENEKERLVGGVFDHVARRYDLMNDLMSGGLHRAWKDAMIAWLAPPRSVPYRLIDVAGGTGDVAFRFCERSGPDASVTIVDINHNMLGVGQNRADKRSDRHRMDFVTGNAESLPVPDKSHDAYTIAFGIRNVTHIDQALADAYRVLKPGGRFLCLEFSEVDIPAIDRLYDLYSFNAIPAMGRVVTGDSEPYQYLVESIRKFPKQERFATMIRDAGFEQVTYRNLAGGVAALHSGWRL
ncbi:MAG: bifunctional demethylmenaquinone methyltransferase/2-methoxy-6-polyprenyl-1,4-benzoquinol methylase UbiE [Pseudomonadota bacterium]